MEKTLFTWENWDIMDTMAFWFYNVVLTIDIGDFKAGTKFTGAGVDYEDGTLTLQDGENEFKFNLHLSVKE